MYDDNISVESDSDSFFISEIESSHSEKSVGGVNKSQENNIIESSKIFMMPLFNQYFQIDHPNIDIFDYSNVFSIES